MKKSRYKYHSVDIPLYFGGLHILIGHDLGALNEAAGFPCEGIRGRDYDCYDAFTFEADKDGFSGYFVLLRPDANPKIIAHEALHLSYFILRARDIQVDPDNHEAQAYLLGWIVGQINFALTSKKVKPSKTIALR